MKHGDIIKLGPHILGCGSSLDKAFVDKVIGENKERGQALVMLSLIELRITKGKKELKGLKGLKEHKKHFRGTLNCFQILKKEP